MAERTGRVERGGDAPRIGGDEGLDPAPLGDRRRVQGLAALLLPVVGGLLLYFAWSISWDRSHPAGSAALAAGKGDAAARLRAIRKLERVGPEDPEVALPALAGAMADSDPDNRAAAIDALLAVIQHVGPAGSAPGGVEDGVRALLERLGDPEATIRLRAVRAMGILVMMWQGTPQALELDRMIAALTALADDPDPRVRLLAVKSLGPAGRKVSDEAPPRVVAALEDPSEDVRSAAAQAIAFTYRRGLVRVLPGLVRSIEKVRPEARPAYLSILEEIRPGHPDSPPREELVPALAAALGTRDREVRALVIATLGEYQDEAREAIPALVALLREPEEKPAPADRPPGPVASIVTPPLNKKAPTDPAILAIEALRRVAGKGRKSISGQAVSVPPVGEVVVALKPVLKSPDPRRRAAAIAALRWFDADAGLVPTLTEAIADRDATVRAAVLRTLGGYVQEMISPPLEALARVLDDDAPVVRMAAAEMLPSLPSGAEAMVPSLLRHARHDPDPQVQEWCASALGQLGPPKVTAAVLPRYREAIENTESPPSLRRSLIEVLPRFGPAARDAIPSLIRAMQPPAGKANPADLGVRLLRQASATALGAIAPGGPRADEAVAALARGLRDPDLVVVAAPALEKFGPAARPAAPDLLRELRRGLEATSPPDAAANCADALGCIAAATPEGEEALTLLLDYLDNGGKNGPNRHRIIAAVGRFGPRAAAALPRLRELATSPDEQVREEARRAVAAIEAPLR